MNWLLTEVDAWVTVVLTAVAMLAGWGAGWWRGRILNAEQQASPASKFTDAVLTLLGLLLAFTFSMSLGRHEQRRQMVVTDSNAIGDFYTTVGLLKEPIRGKLHSVLRRYVEHRLTISQGPAREATLQQRISETQSMHYELELLVKEAVDGGTPVLVRLVNTLNAVTSSQAPGW